MTADVVRRVTDRCAVGGLDLVHPFTSESDTLGVLIGNTRAFWSVARQHIDPGAERPLDEYVERVVGEAIEGLECTVRYAHIPPFVPIQRIAHDTGFAYLASTNLSIHPVYGPWIGLRAVVECTEPSRLPRLPAANPCPDCACSGPLADAEAHPDDWTKRLAVRDACTLGREYRYSDEQIRYHYTKNRTYLTRRS